MSLLLKSFQHSICIHHQQTLSKAAKVCNWKDLFKAGLVGDFTLACQSSGRQDVASIKDFLAIAFPPHRLHPTCSSLAAVVGSPRSMISTTCIHAAGDYSPRSTLPGVRAQASWKKSHFLQFDSLVIVRLRCRCTFAQMALISLFEVEASSSSTIL
jgi:hypothetical protein